MDEKLELANVPAGVLAALKARAKQQGRSVEDEVRAILEQAVAEGAIPAVRLMPAATPSPVRAPTEDED